VSETATRPQAQNGLLFLGGWDDDVRRWLIERWPFATCGELAPGLIRVDLSGSEPGLCPGFNDAEGLRLVSELKPNAVAMGYFCDGVHGAEGVRIFAGGKLLNRQHMKWDEAQIPDPIVWPIGKLAMSVQLPPEAVVQVERPARPPLSLAMEDLLHGKTPSDTKAWHQALEAMGQLQGEPVTDALTRQLQSDDWQVRFYAARSYACQPRGQGQDARPPLDSLLDDDDEGVREAVLEGLLNLIQQVEFSDAGLLAQIDAAIERGLADDDEDVSAAATKAQALRQQLLG
jgi:hypothetical protein